MANNPFEKANEKKRITELLKERDVLRLEVKILKQDLSEARMRASLFESAANLNAELVQKSVNDAQRLEKKLYQIRKILNND